MLNSSADIQDISAAHQSKHTETKNFAEPYMPKVSTTKFYTYGKGVT